MWLFDRESLLDLGCWLVDGQRAAAMSSGRRRTVAHGGAGQCTRRSLLGLERPATKWDKARL
jgi:hypothetical protein